VTRIEGAFEKGDIVKICTENAQGHATTIAHGVAQYGSESAQNLVGQKNQKPLVHYDYLFIVG
jgi:glutamate 5-kinase